MRTKQFSAKEEQIETYRSEPYVYAQMIAGKDAPCFGEAKKQLADGHRGLGLKVDPCIPKSWPGFTATRKYRGVEYRIEIKNPNGICKGVKSVVVDGKKVAGNVIPYEAGKEIVKVEITLEA